MRHRGDGPTHTLFELYVPTRLLPTSQAYFEHLDHTGGFFYERWGDAPVHSLAAAMFLNASEVSVSLQPATDSALIHMFRFAMLDASIWPSSRFRVPAGWHSQPCSQNVNLR